MDAAAAGLAAGCRAAVAAAAAAGLADGAADACAGAALHYWTNGHRVANCRVGPLQADFAMHCCRRSLQHTNHMLLWAADVLMGTRFM